jgi:hypothetical protein
MRRLVGNIIPILQLKLGPPLGDASVYTSSVIALEESGDAGQSS